MELNSCPADEADYVDAFVQNLKNDIRLRLENNGRSRMRRLSDVFRDAQFMESMISWEETVNKIASKFEAPNPFDKMPNRVSADSLADKLHPNYEYNAELQETEDVSLEKTDHGTDTLRFATTKEEAVIKLDHEHSEMNDSSLTGLSLFSTPVLIEDSAYSLALEALIWLFEEDKESPPTNHLLDQTEEIDESYSCGSVLHRYEVGQSYFLTVRSVKYGFRLLEEMPQLVLTSLQSIPQYSKSLFLGEGCSSATKLGVVKVSCKVLDEMPRPFSVQPNEEISGHKRIDIQFCKGEISRHIFDPGGYI